MKRADYLRKYARTHAQADVNYAWGGVSKASSWKTRWPIAPAALHSVDYNDFCEVLDE